MSKPKPFRNPHHLPTKICPVCGKPFTWRKKWERDWAGVVYCSDKCRRAGGPSKAPCVEEPCNKLHG